MDRGTTKSTAEMFRQKSQKVNPSTKTSKQPQNVFGTSSQFRGVQTGDPGDPRK